MDFLTVSMGEEDAAFMRSRSRLVEPGAGRPGFARSELRDVMGGQAWRRWEPRQPSKLWGLEYESWEASGSSAWGVAFDLRGRKVRPSRVDVAWDFEAFDDLTADQVAESIAAECERRGFGLGISGENGVNTRYIGSRKSERRIRIYRRDLKDPALAFAQGPILRVELVLRRDLAEAWWPVFCDDLDGAWAAAAAHVYEMTGRAVQPEIGQIPELQRVDEAVDAAQMVLQFVQQHASMIGAIQDAGVDLFTLAGEVRSGWDRAMRSKHKRRVSTLVSAGADRIERIVLAMLAGAREPAPV